MSRRWGAAPVSACKANGRKSAPAADAAIPPRSERLSILKSGMVVPLLRVSRQKRGRGDDGAEQLRERAALSEAIFDGLKLARALPVVGIVLDHVRCEIHGPA